MTKLRDVIPKGERERWEAMSEEEREDERRCNRRKNLPVDHVDDLLGK
ncbi:MAG: hypothetical protein OXE40_01675 [Gammaproteobacteria bacterium]|nr:hypothetical protein [Gammaproteobacteria bacterium]